MSDVVDQGGDPACWAHLYDEPAEQFVERLADAVVVSDRDGTIVQWNAAAEALFGWSAAEALGQSLDLIVPERFRERHWQGYHRAVETGAFRQERPMLEVPALHRDGRKLSIAFTITMLTDSNGDVARLVAVIRDDTANWQARHR
jgi:PAS domain S-box-containing protein